ncbi:MAG: hypothetical protein ABSF38_08655 [Verrucomicrobiota bacterium]|jgi:hypothetical protein
MRPASLILASLFFAGASPAQPAFRAYASSLELAEGGKIDTMVVVLGAERVTVRVPHGYGAQVRADKNSVVFTDKDGTTAITLKATADSPGVMPDEEVLRSKALAANPGGTNLEWSTCPTGYKPAKVADSVRTVTSSLSLKVRHAFVACPEGTLEVICAANGVDFENACVVFNALISSLQVELVNKAETPPPH